MSDAFSNPDLIAPPTEAFAFPASAAQEAFYYLEKLAPSHPAFNVPVRFELIGALDLRLLQASFVGLAERQEGLRTRFFEDDGKLLQIVTPEASFPLKLIDVSHFKGKELTDELDRLGSIEAKSHFDLSNGLLFRASLIILARDRHILQITIHHSIADGWSIGIMTDELSEFYNSYLESREPRLDPLAIQYADFTIWQRQSINSEELTPHLDFWKSKLLGYTELEFPTDRPRPLVKSWDGDVVTRTLSPSICEKVARISKEKGATTFHVFLAAFKAVASRYTGLEDIAVGSPVAGRTRRELEPIIGTFINSVILRTSLGGDPSFGELVERVRDTVTEAIAHSDLPFEQLVKTLQPRRESGRNPLFQVNFTQQRDFAKPVAFGDAKLKVLSQQSPGAIFDLHFFMAECATGWSASCDFSRDLFDRGTAERLLYHFEVFLDAATGAPEVPISRLPILTGVERTSIAQWAGRQFPYPSTSSIGELFLEQAGKHATRIALTSSTREISYQLLAASALETQGRLIEAGVKLGDRVALCAHSVPEMVSAQIAILLCGAACVPLDPDYPSNRLRFMLNDSGASALLVTPQLASLLPVETPTLLLSPLPESLDQPAIGSFSIPPDAASHIFYTSGSTGVPKGVVVRHRGVSRLALGGDFMKFGPDDSFYQAAPISFDAASLEIWMPLLNGGRVVLSGDGGPSLPAIARAIREHGVTCLWLTAGLFQSMVDEHLSDLSGLRYLLAGGDVLSPAHVRRAFEALPKTTLINGYGPTENSTFTCCHTITPADLVRVSIPIGKPLGNTRVHLLDSRMRPVPVGVAGELFTGGDGLALGYLNQEELTKEKFPLHPDLGQLYRTGDLCRWLPDGSIEFLERVDSQLKIRGFRIELGEIEAHLASHSTVRQAKVVARGDTAESRQIVAWVVSNEGQTAVPSTLSSFLTELLPSYMRPQSIAVIDAFPLNSNGKIDVSALPDPSLTRTFKSSNIHEPPVGRTEEGIASIWRDLLSQESIERDDDFFELGGHSLLALRLFSRLNREFNCTLPLAALINNPTIRELATLVDPVRERESPPEGTETPKGHFVTIRKEGDQAPLFCIHGGDGGVIFYRDLATYLPGGYPLHAVESLELCRNEAVNPTSVEDTADHYVHTLLDGMHRGPFRLAGYSFGGIVAHAMACQLVKMGYKVSFLGLFDTHSPIAEQTPYSSSGRLARFWKQHGHLPIPSRISLLRKRIREGIKTNTRVRAEILEAQTSGPAAAYSDLRRIQVREENWRSMQIYHPPAFPGTITLFKAITGSDKFEWPEDYGWSQSAGGGLRIVAVPGGHLTLFEPENVKALANSLHQSLCGMNSLT